MAFREYEIYPEFVEQRQLPQILRQYPIAKKMLWNSC
jgi:hypothetical protein